MAKNKVNGNWILTRESDTPESARQVEKDDPLFKVLHTYFQGQQTVFNLEAISLATGVDPADVFVDLHENYGYICIGTGENPAAGEKLSQQEREQRQQAIATALENAHIPHIKIKGKYMGIEEVSYFIPYNDNTIGLTKLLQSDLVSKVEKIAQAHNQDSLLICQKGCACYLYTSGAQKGTVITGKSAVVYPGKEQLPDDCYSLFITNDNDGKVGFTCGLNFNRIYTNIDEFTAEDNKTLQDEFSDFVTAVQESTDIQQRKKHVIILRGADGYNQYAVALKNEFKRLGINAELIGTDANIAKINEEVAQDNKTNGPKANWQWPEIRNEFIMRNKRFYDALLKADNIDVVVYADMNKNLQFMDTYVSTAAKHGHHVIIDVVNSFVFEPNRTNFLEQLCDKHGAFMGRHLADFKKPEAQIHAEQVELGEIRINQLQGFSVETLANMVCRMIRDERSANALASGTVFNFNKDKREPCEISAENDAANRIDNAKRHT